MNALGGAVFVFGHGSHSLPGGCFFHDTPVTEKCKGVFAGAIIDKFGKQCMFIPTTDGEYSVVINAAVTPALFSWIFNFGSGIRITEPEYAVNEYKKLLKETLSAMGE